MNTVQLKYFITVAETLSFTQAAKELFVAQTAISQQIAALERELDVTLFKRTTRTVHLTAAGNALYHDAKSVLAQLERATFKAKQYDSGAAGFLNLGFPGKHGMNFLTGLLKAFRNAHPNTGLTLSIEGNEVLQQAIKRELLDITFTFCRTTDRLQKDRDIYWLDLDTYPLCAVLPSDHPLADRKLIDWEEIRHETLLSGYMPGNLVEKNTDELNTLRINDPVFLLHSPQPPVYSDDALMPLIEAGYGIAILPSFRQTKGQEAPRFILLSGLGEGPHLMLGWRRNNPNPAVRDFLEVFLQYYPVFNPRFTPPESLNLDE